MRMAINILLAGILLVVVSIALQLPASPHHPGHTILYEQFFDSATEHTLDARITRFERADTTWKEASTFYDRQGNAAAAKTCYSVDERGVLCVRGTEFVKEGERHHASHTFDADAARQDQSYVRDDEVLGYPVIVQHFLDGTGSAEMYVAPAVNGAVLKAVYDSGQGFTNTVTATLVQVGEPAVFEVPDYPVKQ